jgi:hypothetical protein
MLFRVKMLFKPSGERRIELATWGLLLIWVGIWLSVDMRRGVPALVTGGLLLGSALLQRVLGYEAGLVLWVGGFAFTLSGLNDLTRGKHHVPAFAIVLVIAGVLMLIRAFAGPQRRRHLRAVTHGRDPRPPVPPVEL